MDANRFDSITKFFAARRLSRRQAIAQGAGTLAVAGLAPATLAQEATPAATGDDGPTMLFVQAFQSGGITPAEGTEGRYTLTLEHGLGHTVYFTDRPYREVGANPTPEFLDRLGFPDDNPPNAALVVETEDGQTEVAVVELFNPAYDDATHTATYEVAVLAEFEREANGFGETDADLAELLPEFGSAHLFIDGPECSNADVWCSTWDYIGDVVNHGFYGYEVGHCYNWGQATCIVCGYQHLDKFEARAVFSQWCNDNYSSCGGQCVAWGVCSTANTCNPHSTS